MDNKQLKSIIERVERLDAVIAETREDIKEVYLEAKSSGYDVPALKKIVSERKQDEDVLNELDSLVYTYKKALEQIEG